MEKKLNVYLASPWFNDEQFERCEFVRDKLKSLGFDVFSPKDENLVDPNADKDWRQQAFEGNVNHIHKADFILAITNGKDMGTIFECGVAYQYGIPIIYFAEGLTGQFNLMLAQSGIHVITDRSQFDDLIKPELIECITYGTPYSEYNGEIE